MKITEATITLKGDPSVGIPETQFRVVGLDLDLDTMEPEDHAEIAEELRTAIERVADVVSGGDHVSVFLHGWDDRNDICADVEESRTRAAESALRNARPCNRGHVVAESWCSACVTVPVNV